MANNDAKNKRLKIGAGILIALTLANFLVRLNRQAPVQPPSPAQSPVQPQNQTPPIARQETQNINRKITVKDSNVTTNALEIDKRLQVLQAELETQAFDLNNLEKPAKAPDLSTPLFLVRQDLFRYDKIQAVKKPAETTATRPVGLPPEPEARPELTAIFATNGQKKLLVRIKDKIYLVKENDMQPEAKFSLVSVVDDKHFILDQEGNEYELQLKPQKDEELQRVLQILKGQNEDSSFAYSINASQSSNPEPESEKP